MLQDVPLHEGIKIPNVSKLRLASGLMACNPASYVSGLTLDETNVRELRLDADTSLSPSFYVSLRCLVRMLSIYLQHPKTFSVAAAGHRPKFRSPWLDGTHPQC